MKITDKRRRVLACLSRREDALTAYDVGVLCKEERRASDWAHQPLREMHDAGLVKTVGVTFGNAKTWRITDAGREALAELGA